MPTTEKEWDAEEHRPWAVLSEGRHLDGFGNDILHARTSIMICATGCVLRLDKPSYTATADGDRLEGGFRSSVVFVPGATWEDFFGKDTPRDAVTWVA
jgi:hypothetical protein